MNNLYQHVRSDKVKWIITGIALVLILAILGGVLAAVLTETNPKDWFEQPAGEETETSDEEAPANTENGGAVIGTPVENGIKLMSAKIPVAEFAANGVSAQAETAHTLTATIVPDTATDKTVDWEVAFVNPTSAWANGKNVTDYVTVTPSVDGALTATVECFQAFGEQIKVVVTTRANASAFAECIVDYQKRVVSFTTQAVYNGTSYGDSTQITWTFFDNNSAENLKMPVFKSSSSGLSTFAAFSGNAPIITWGEGTITPEVENITYSIQYDSALVSAASSRGLTPNTGSDGWILVSQNSTVAMMMGPYSIFKFKDSNDTLISMNSAERVNVVLSALREANGVVGTLRCVIDYGEGLTVEQTCDVGFAPSSIGLVAESVSLGNSSLVF